MTSTFKNFALESRPFGIFLTFFVKFLVNFLIWIFHRINYSYVQNGAWGGVVVKALCYQSEGPGIDPRSLGIFSGASDSSMCPGVEYQDIPGGEDGR